MITISAKIKPGDARDVLLDELVLPEGQHFGFGFINYNGLIGIVLSGRPGGPYMVPSGGSVEFVCTSTKDTPTNLLEMG